MDRYRMNEVLITLITLNYCVMLSFWKQPRQNPNDQRGCETGKGKGKLFLYVDHLNFNGQKGFLP